MADGAVDRHFRAMGSGCRIVLFGGEEDLADRLVERVHELERRWSRFRPDSEISRLNESGGPALVSSDTVRLIELSMEAHRITAGRFEPLMLLPLRELGYDRDHQRLAITREAIRVDATRTVRTAAGSLLLDAQLGCVELPDGAAFDPGGIGKGAAADLVAEEARRAGVDGAMVDLGGDLRVIGAWPGGEWPIRVADPRRPDRDLCTLDITGGGVATSSTIRRRWRHGAHVHHHLLDPATGLPSETDLVAATVHAGSAWAADVLAKVAVIEGRERAELLLGRVGANGVLVGTDGVIHRVGEIRESDGVREVDVVREADEVVT